MGLVLKLAAAAVTVVVGYYVLAFLLWLLAKVAMIITGVTTALFFGGIAWAVWKLWPLLSRLMDSRGEGPRH
ncbi:hypothetical protein WCLP8_4360002 [uncultured Gammaproteobacteria bacterium]